MNKIVWLIFILGFTNVSFAQNFKQSFIATDIDNFWTAYDKIITAKDSVQQYALLKELYLNKGTEGLKDLIEVRDYSENEFINWITQYPNFWKSIRHNTYKVNSLYPKIEANIQKLKMF